MLLVILVRGWTQCQGDPKASCIMGRVYGPAISQEGAWPRGCTLAVKPLDVLCAQGTRVISLRHTDGYRFWDA